MGQTGGCPGRGYSGSRVLRPGNPFCRTGGHVPHLLEIGSGTPTAESRELAEGRTVIGRQPGCGIVIQDSAASRHHAAIDVSGPLATLVDLGSRNGTTVNGLRIGAATPLFPGDTIGIGALHIVYRGVDAPAPGGDPGHTITAADDFHDTGNGGSSIIGEIDVPDASSGDAAAALGRALGASLSEKEVLPKLLDGLLSIFPKADRGFVFFRHRESGRWLRKETRFRGREEQGAPKVSQSVWESVVRSGKAVLSSDLLGDSRFDQAQSIMASSMRSVMCVPIRRSDGEIIGVVQLDTRESASAFSPRDLSVLAGLASIVAKSVEHAQAHDERVEQEKLKRDLEIAHSVQQGLLPATPPTIAGYDLFHHYAPALHVGGDYFNYVPLSGGRMACVLADVSGKGVSAALVMANLAGEVRYRLASESDLTRAVGAINDAFCLNGWDERFATFAVIVLDPPAHRASIVNAGHLPVYVRGPDGSVAEIGPEQGGLPLGMMPGWEYRQTDVDVVPGTVMTVFTDGVSEAMDVEDRIFGLDRIGTALAADPTETAEAIGRRILRDVERHAVGQVQTDDICLVCIGRPR